jgi:hypothetical protein
VDFLCLHEWHELLCIIMLVVVGLWYMSNVSLLCWFMMVKSK